MSDSKNESNGMNPVIMILVPILLIAAWFGCLMRWPVTTIIATIIGLIVYHNYETHQQSSQLVTHEYVQVLDA